MIFQGRYENETGIFRPYISADVLSPANEWVEVDFLVDTGADETFLDFSFVRELDIDTRGIDVKDDVGGVGGSGVPYFQIDSALKLISPGGTKVFKGKVNIFLDPHSSEVPLLGRDVLDNFVAIFDREQSSILLLDEEEEYGIKTKTDRLLSY
ncbi:retropepsin-like domain-containing protein [bacterium]|nr:retropepsin-like domain-containing protein [bacterium]